MEWLKSFVDEETYGKIVGKMRGVYDTIHPPNLVRLK